MGTFRRMPTKSRKNPPERWKGDEVEDAPEGTAERAANRVEGNTPITVSDAVERAEEDEAVGELPKPDREALSPKRRSPRSPRSTRRARPPVTAGVARSEI